MVLDRVSEGLTYKSAWCLLDDIGVFSSSIEDHYRDLQEVFDRLKTAGLRLSAKNSNFFQDKCIFLGHEISEHGSSPPFDRIKVVQEFPLPKNPREVKRAMGLFQWFKKYIPNFSSIALPKNKLLRKGNQFHWGQTGGAGCI